MSTLLLAPLRAEMHNRLVLKDPECENMNYTLDPNVSFACSPKSRYSARKIPKVIHQARIGSELPLESAEETPWGKYCQDTGFTYCMWTEHIPELEKIFGKKNYALFKQLCREQLYKSAEDLLKYEVLRAYGGVFVGKEIMPPMQGEAFVDLEKVIPLRGIQVLVSKAPVNVGNSAIYADSSFLACCKKHPIPTSLCAQIRQNVEHYRRKTGKHVRRYSTGSVFLSSALTGSVGVLQPNYIKQYGMLRDSK
ncbi:hypothetical protein NEFER03_0965 [Nematocida sp. LUAm3]|nr:hypothetical protein NEFER03_0802 [Nematocida sp. LUAm3]KAI5171660.1 hypothetical protein NEFER03_0965 [Nematocida sp. LUAm3]KAI5175431.1 hypothetical protein NEFER02_1360 [Nematocida sp. LUAm2]KAI5177612.1 hypothetical protein NEFER01_0836 [Nematocida sp. LUAm1]